MKWLDNWFKKRLNKELDLWLKEHEGILAIDAGKEVDALNEKVKSLTDTISEIEHITLKVPIEEYLLNSERFQGSMKSLKNYALKKWDLPSEYPLREPSLSNLHGTVTEKTPFKCLINERTMIMMAGLKVRYDGKDQALYSVRVRDQTLRPFVVGPETQQIIFPLFYLLEEEYCFAIIKLEGLGNLMFSIIGEVITTKFNAPEFNYL